MNAPAGSGFFANFAAKFPFGQSNQSNPVVPGTPNGNPNFPSNTQLQPKNDNHNPNPPQNGQDGNPDPNNSADPNKGTQGSPLDAFKDLFTIKTDDKGQPIAQPQDPMAEPIFKLDPQQLAAAAQKANFTAGITQEDIQKAQQDPNAMLQLMNRVAQNGFLGAVTSLTNVVETAVQRNNERFEKALPDRIRNTQINQAQAKHPSLSHPAAAPLVSAMKSQIAATNPHLPPERVAEMAEQYFISLATDVQNVNQRQEQNNKPKNPAEVDWSILGGPNG